MPGPKDELNTNKPIETIEFQGSETKSFRMQDGEVLVIKGVTSTGETITIGTFGKNHDGSSYWAFRDTSQEIGTDTQNIGRENLPIEGTMSAYSKGMDLKIMGGINSNHARYINIEGSEPYDAEKNPNPKRVEVLLTAVNPVQGMYDLYATGSNQSDKIKMTAERYTALKS